MESRRTRTRAAGPFNLWSVLGVYYGTLQSTGAIESFEPVIFNPTGGDLNGIILIRGSLDQLDALKREDRFIDLMMRAEHACEGLGVNDAYLEGELQSRMGRWTQIISE